MHLFSFLPPSLLKCQIKLESLYLTWGTTLEENIHPFKIRTFKCTPFINIVRCWQGYEELEHLHEVSSSQREYCCELSGRQSGTMYRNVKCVPLAQKQSFRMYNREIIICKDVSTRLNIRAFLTIEKKKKKTTPVGMRNIS